MALCGRGMPHCCNLFFVILLGTLALSDALGRRGRSANYMSTKGSFALSSNRAGNDEAELGSDVDDASSQHSGVQELGGSSDDQALVHGGTACPVPKGYKRFARFPAARAANCATDGCVLNGTTSELTCVVIASTNVFQCKGCDCDTLCETCYDMRVQMDEYMSKVEQKDCYNKYFVLQAQALNKGLTSYSACASKKVGQGCALKEPASKPTAEPTMKPTAGGCTSKMASVPDSWCTANCNAAVPNCPASICSCN